MKSIFIFNDNELKKYNNIETQDIFSICIFN